MLSVRTLVLTSHVLKNTNSLGVTEFLLLFVQARSRAQSVPFAYLLDIRLHLYQRGCISLSNGIPSYVNRICQM